MKKIVLLLMGLLFLAGLASAYQVNIEAPDSLSVGKPLLVTGTTTFGIGTPIDIVLYRQLTTTKEVKRKIVYVQSDRSFKAVFDTTGLEPGVYKVEVPTTANMDSVSMQLVTLFDRSEDIYLTSALNQSYTGKIYVAGEITDLKNSGVQVEVINPDGVVVFGPQYINTDNAAHFSADIPIPAAGSYEVSFTDSQGYIGSRTINAIGAGGATAAVTAVPTTVQTTIAPVSSAHTQASRDAPAYFIVKTGTGPVSLYTSKSQDWVIEYIDERGTLQTENDQGSTLPEKVELTGKGKTIYVKVYPYKYSVTSEVFLYGENVNSITVSKTIPEPFAASAPTTAEEAPAMPVAGALAVAAVLTLIGRRTG